MKAFWSHICQVWPCAASPICMREAKSDARDAAIIAEAAHSMPHTLRSLRLADEQLAELTMLCGFDDDLAAQITQTSNRIRGLLTQIHPALERVLGPRLDHPADSSRTF
jgi:transposase